MITKEMTTIENKQKDYATFESGVEGYEGTLIDIQKDDEDTIRVRWETDEYECGMYITRESDVWDINSYDFTLDTWAADGPFQDYSDDNIWDFINEAILYWRDFIKE